MVSLYFQRKKERIDKLKIFYESEIERHKVMNDANIFQRCHKHK